MSQTTYQKLEKPLDREQLLEVFLQQRLEEVGNIFGDTYIDGLHLEWLSSNSIKVKPGSCDFSDGSRRLRVTADITLSGLSLSASTWYHVYVYNNGGVPAAEVISEATATPTNYQGTAYRKGSDGSRRYVGSLRTDVGGGLLTFRHFDGNRIRYLIDAPLVLSGGTATTETAVACSSFVPVTSRVAIMHVLNISSTGTFYIGAGPGASDDSVTPPSSGILVVGQTNGSKDVVDAIPLNSSRQASYAFGGTPGLGGYIYLLGYIFER